LGVLGRRLMVRTDFDAEHPTQSGHQVEVIRMRGPSGLLRVVADPGAFLMLVERGGMVVSASRIQGR
jgi:hypothetical protein